MGGNCRDKGVDGRRVGQIGDEAMPVGRMLGKDRGQNRIRLGITSAVDRQCPAVGGQPRRNDSAQPPVSASDEGELHLR